MYKCYPDAKRAHLKSGGNFPYLSRTDEVVTHLEVILQSSIYVSIYLFMYLSMYLCMYVCMYVCIYLSIDPSFAFSNYTILC